MKIHYIDVVKDWNTGTAERISPMFDTYQECYDCDIPDEHEHNPDIVIVSDDVEDDEL